MLVIALIAIGTIVGLVVLGWAALGFYVANQITRPVSARASRDDTPGDGGVPFSEIAIPRRDGLALPGWWLPNHGHHVLVICYGFRSWRAGVLGIAGEMWRRGFD